MARFKDLTGQKFGRLTVIEPTTKRKQGSVVWRCICECGNEAFVAGKNLKQGNTSSCGCRKSETTAKSNKKRLTKDIRGKKFGKLTAIEPIEKRDNGFTLWKCICECGNETYVNIRNLNSGNTKSCGCLNRELAKKNARKNIDEYIKKNYIADTRLDFMESNKLNKNNTTGYKGIYLRKKDGKYTAHIEFQKKRYFLGSYNTKEEAYEVRKKAEEKLFGDFLKWYNENHK